jgi:hypothetical protein
MVFHVLNRGVGRRTLFEKDGDYLAFERMMEETSLGCLNVECCASPFEFVPQLGRAFLQYGIRRHDFDALADITTKVSLV